KELDPPDVRAEEIELLARLELRERVRLVRHEGDLRLVLRVALVVGGEHRLPTVVAVAGPVEHLQPSRLGSQPLEPGASLTGTGAEKRRAASNGRELQELFPGEPPRDEIMLVCHRYLLRLPLLVGAY